MKAHQFVLCDAYVLPLIYSIIFTLHNGSPLCINTYLLESHDHGVQEFQGQIQTGRDTLSGPACFQQWFRAVCNLHSLLLASHTAPDCCRLWNYSDCQKGRLRLSGGDGAVGRQRWWVTVEQRRGVWVMLRQPVGKRCGYHLSSTVLAPSGQGSEN